MVEQREEVLANDNTEEELKELSDKISEAEEEIVRMGVCPVGIMRSFLWARMFPVCLKRKDGKA